ncbi:hypothetical protein ES332_A12G174300v1 [Gossypium tomentosum]|uniref:Uncharacterized protein n=1 Tax=Gossypium tomentosum TaxID=34277 RepID=A0A5D2MZ29_GOSTO|nr:hypothetical protein ES332_A12G174300v1 [Gossypium tomentosum]
MTTTKRRKEKNSTAKKFFVLFLFLSAIKPKRNRFVASFAYRQKINTKRHNSNQKNQIQSLKGAENRRKGKLTWIHSGGHRQRRRCMKHR